MTGCGGVSATAFLVLLAAASFLPREARGLGHCPILVPPPFGRLTLNGSTDIPESEAGHTVEYECAEGYTLVTTANKSLQLSGTSTVCEESGNWTLTGVECIVSDAIFSPYNIVLIILGGVAAIGLIFMCITLCCCLWACKLKRDITKGDFIENEVEYARSRGGIVFNNPLVTPRDDESLGNPLYLTPEEIDENFQEKKRPRSS